MNCKPGDLAIVVRSLHTPELIGRIVEVVSVAVNGEIFKAKPSDIRLNISSSPELCWRVRSSNPLPWRMRDDSLRYVHELPAMDSCLRPITGLPLNEETHDEVTA